MTYDSLVNHGDYLSAHYLAQLLPRQLKAKDGLLARWAAAEEAERRRHTEAVAEAKRRGDDPSDPSAVPPRARTPREGLRALHGPYFAGRADFVRDAAALGTPEAPAPGDWAKRVTDLHLATLHALGFTGAHEQTVTVERSGHQYAVHAAHAEPGILAVSCGWTARPDEAFDTDGAGRLLHPVESEGSAAARSALPTDGKALTDLLFECDEPPRYVLLLAGGVLVLADRMAWHEGRYLAVSLDAALDRRDDRNGGELDTVAALFGADSLRVPEEGGVAPLADFVERSAKHAVGVSTELREGLRLSVEWIANAVLERLREQGVRPEEIGEPAKLAKQLSRESLRYLYRILFLLYAEAQPALGILPADHPEYVRGYSLQRLGDLVVRDLVGERSRRRFHLSDSLDLLFRMVDEGHRARGTEPEDDAPQAGEKGEAEQDGEEQAKVSVAVGLRFEPLRSQLFAPGAVRLIGDGLIENPHHDPQHPDDQPQFLDTRLRNETLHRVLRRLMLTKGKGRERGGFISYAQLGINQLGAVYEGLMSYTGFIAEEDLYEVAKGGDPSGGSWMIPRSKAADYPDEVFVSETDEATGVRQRVVHPTGSFVYRLAGRDRQTSASYYTPESLTRVTVELALRERLDENTRAGELLQWKICEPALGSGAFLNEAVNQVAEEYLRRRERELGERVDTDKRQIELQKVKAYVALHNAYGVDLNATAVELAEVSLWLNTMHPGMRAPWFGLHLRRGNSLIGAGRKVYAAADVPKGAWLSKSAPKAPTELPFRDGPLPHGAVHHFLLPAVGWGSVAGETEAKRLAPDAAKQLDRWRRAVRKAPKTKGDLRRLQGIARRVEFLWELVRQRLELSEEKVARRIDVWGAEDLLTQTDQAVDRQEVLRALVAPGTPYWRLKKVMDAWCALWFWPLDAAGELDGTAPVYERYGAAGGPVVSAPELAGLLEDESEGSAEPDSAEQVDSAEPGDTESGAAPEAPTGPAPGDLDWEAGGLFDDPDGEQGRFAVEAKSTASQEKSQEKKKPPRGRSHNIPDDYWRGCIPLASLDDWLDFLECVVGTADVPEDSIMRSFNSLEVLADYEDKLDGLMHMDRPLRLQSRFPWLDRVEDIAGTTGRDIQAEDGNGFFHWELHFAHVFSGERGGFDLQVGNPPWVRPRWEEDSLLAEYEPWFMLTEKAAKAEKSRKREQLIASEQVSEYLRHELAAHSGTGTMLSSEQMYPLLTGTQPDLYRAFMCRTWKHAGDAGTVGLVHPDSHFSGDKEARLREAAYERLRVHGDFVNSGNRFFPPPVGRSSHFGVHIYGAAREEIGFDHLSWLFSVDALRLSYQDDGKAPDPGVRYGNEWDERPHWKRIVRVDEKTLGRWQRLTGDSDQSARQGRLLSPVSTAEADAIAALADYPLRLAAYDPDIASGYHETGAKNAGLIDYNLPGGDGSVHWPTGWSEVVLKGPQLGLANPLFKQPSQGGGEVRGLNPLELSDDAVPESGFVYVADEEVYEGARERCISQRKLTQFRSSESHVAMARAAVARSRGVLEERVSDSETDAHLVRLSESPYTDFYRVAWREFIAPDTERSLYVTLLPPGPAHIHAIRSTSFLNNSDTVLTCGFWSGIPIDYLLRSTRIRHLDTSPARRLPVPSTDHPLASALLLRTLRLNCLTPAYADLWAELYDPSWSSEAWARDWPGLSPFVGPLRRGRGQRLYVPNGPGGPCWWRLTPW